MLIASIKATVLWHVPVCFRAFFEKIKLEFADILEANKVDMNNVSLTFQRVLQFPLRRTLEYQKLLATVADLYPAVSLRSDSFLGFSVLSLAFSEPASHR